MSDVAERTADLEKFKLVILERLDEQLIESVASRPQVETIAGHHFWEDTLTLRITQEEETRS